MATYGCSEYELMERAGAAVAHQVCKFWPQARRIVVCCGGGNNGGDGYVVARLLMQQGLEVNVYQVGDHGRLPQAASNAYLRCQTAGVAIQPFGEMAVQDLHHADVIVDALLGIGITGTVRADYVVAIDAINQAGKPVVAVDVPSGINVDNGSVCGVAVQALRTVTFIAYKRGLFTGAAPAYCGEIHCVDLDLPAELMQQLPAAAQLLQHAVVTLPPRRKDANKGQFGHVLVVGGNYGMAGAVRMAGEAAARVGAGLVSIATRPEHAVAIASSRPELMCHGICTAQDLAPLLARATVLVLGPGLGQDAWAEALCTYVLQQPQPKIIDADGLNWLAKQPRRIDNAIMTPHPGEAGRMLGCTAAEIQADRFAAAQRLQDCYGGVMVLKGAGTLIQGGEAAVPAVCRAGNPGMASGGMGDVLTGVLAGLVAQGLALAQAAYLGVWLHATAADHVARDCGERGMLAMDVVPEVRRLLNGLGSY